MAWREPRPTINLRATAAAIRRSGPPGQLHFEPFWGVLVAALSGFDPDGVLRLYPFLPLLVAAAFVLSLYWGLGARAEDGSCWSPWERVLCVGFATLLSSAPLDFVGITASRGP
jgi:hypothetical protein